MADKPPRKITININGVDIELDDGEYTGAQLKEVGNVPEGEALFLQHGNGHEVRVEDTEIIKVHPNMKFESSPDGGVS